MKGISYFFPAIGSKFNSCHDNLGQFCSGSNEFLVSLESKLPTISSDKEQSLYVFNKLGFTNKPTIVNNLENEIKEGDILFYRGVKSEDIVDQFKNGDYILGKGAFGRGIYTATGEIGLTGAMTYGKNEKNIIKGALDKSAKIANYDNLRKERVEKLREYPNLNDLGRSNEGLAAALLGYDAIEIPGSNTLLILNRSKVKVEK